MLKLLSGLFKVYLILAWILGILLHLWTVYIAYSGSGLIGGILSFIFPVLSEIYWGYKAWSLYALDTSYVQWLIVFFFMWVFQYLFAFIVGTLEDKFSKDINY
jgi:hypothetical protein